ncbi:MAG TPA: acetylornithine/succinylornithine family transaminase [Tepidisphaeraceae bacterium]
MQQWLDRGRGALTQNYARLPVVMERGEGCHLWDADGKRYLDLFAGFGGAILGHCHRALMAAAAEQAAKLWHVGNQFYSEPQIEVAERLSKTAFAGQAFFCHSGAEANEAACKLARLYGGEKKRWKIISLQKSFHGRTLAMIAATGNPAVRTGFAPDVPGFVQVEPGNFDALLAAVDEETAAILMEPIQGEGGVNFYPPEYPRRVRELCTQRQLTLIFDEVWTGCGRTGRWFAHQHLGVEPDVMTLGKAAGGGLPVGIMFAKPQWAELFGPGKHGSTLGGNAICMAVTRTIFDVIEREKLLENAATLGEHAIGRLRDAAAIREKVAEVRGRGLMLGIELKAAPEKLVERALERGLVINLTAQKVIRLAPPISIGRADWDAGLDMLMELIAGA